MGLGREPSRPVLEVDHRRRDANESRDLRGLLRCAVVKTGFFDCLPYPKERGRRSCCGRDHGQGRELDLSLENVSDHVDRIKTLSNHAGFFHGEERSYPVNLAFDDLGDFIPGLVQCFINSFI